MDKFREQIEENQLLDKVHIFKSISTSEEEISKSLENDISKGKRAILGEIREYSGIKYMKELLYQK